MKVEYTLLGEVGILVDGRPVDSGHARQRGVLAVLAASANVPVSIPQLQDRLWDDDPAAPTTLRGYFTRLRQAVPPGTAHDIVRRSGGYVLVTAPGAVDLWHFRELCDKARAQPDGPRALGLFEEALALFRGVPLTGVDSGWLDALRHQILEERAAAELDRDDLALRHAPRQGMSADLRTRLAARPLDERLTGQLMLALCREGRQAEALEVYGRQRRLLADELGVDPGPGLAGLYQRILHGDVAPPAAVGAPPPRPGPAQLPAAVPQFVGRTGELSTVTAAVRQPAGSAPVVAAVGTAGVGKTAFVMHWAHRHLDAFPDGQLHLDLRGYGEAAPVSTSAALATLLRSLGAAEVDIPADVDARAALYRSTLAGRRALVVLDNARSAQQIRPLLPGAGGVTVLVTSRDMLAGLVVRDGAVRVLLERLPDHDAAELLRRVIGEHRTAREPAAVAQIASACDALPLALRVAAERAVRHPRQPLAALADELADSARRLELLDTGDALTRVHNVFSWSLRDLPPDAARLFRLLGPHPVVGITPGLAARLTGLRVDEATRQLALLANACLLETSAPGAYQMHDLLRSFATTTCEDTDSGSDREAALAGFLDWYAEAAEAAIATLAPQPAPGDAGTSIRWLSAELRDAIGAVELGRAAGMDDRVLRLHRPLVAFCHQRRRVDEALALLHTALECARRSGDRRVEAEALLALGDALAVAHRFPEARRAHDRAADLYGALGDRTGEATVLLGVGVAHGRAARYPEALEYLNRSADRARAAGDDGHWARCQVNIATAHTQIGQFAEAATHYHRALTVFDAAADRRSQAAALAGISTCSRELGSLDEAVTSALRSIDLARAVGDLGMEEYGLFNLSMAHSALGRHAEALEAMTGAVRIVDGTGDPQRRCNNHGGLGDVQRAAGLSAEARASYRTALALAVELDDQRHIAMNSRNLTALDSGAAAGPSTWE
ncbi:BTAD domain-containing putative transcriptional regulator [Longispora urticae]